MAVDLETHTKDRTMKILISEDNEQKRVNIKNILVGIFPDAEFKYPDNVSKTVRLMDKDNYDILIQDMQLPMVRDGRIDPMGGIEALRYAVYEELVPLCILCSSDCCASDYIPEEMKGVEFVHYNSFNVKDAEQKFKRIVEKRL